MINPLILNSGSGSGKSTFLIKSLYENKDRYKSIVGYTTRRVLNQGKHLGFTTIDINEALEIYSNTLNEESVLKVDVSELVLDDIFLYAPQEQLGFKQEVFEEQFSNHLHNWKNSDLIVIDEIGGKELLNNYIFNYLKSIINSDIKKIFIYKNDAQFGGMFKRFTECPSQPLLYRRTLLEVLLKKESNFITENLSSNIDSYLKLNL